jgi:hypothetical protein
MPDGEERDKIYRERELCRALIASLNFRHISTVTARRRTMTMRHSGIKWLASAV